MQRWVNEKGGLLSDASQCRAEHALERLTTGGGIELSLRIAVLDSEEIGAFSWRSGDIFVARGLMDLVDDDELLAAIAHEAGHLLAAGHIPGAAALDGCRRSTSAIGGARRAQEDAEMVADRLACETLRVSALPDDGLPRLLNKLARHPTTSAACRDQLHRRIATLSAR
jgi:predicted Zn-dependent protease